MQQNGNEKVKRFSIKKLAILALPIIFLVWIYATPYLAVYGMKKAIKQDNASALSEYVNFPSLKENLKMAFRKKMADDLREKKGEIGNGEIIGMAIADTLVNHFSRSFHNA